MGRVFTAGDYDWPAVVVNPGKAQKSWGRLSWILSREGADPKVSGNFYKAVAQAVLLLGAETWVLTQRMERALDSFQSRVARSTMWVHFLHRHVLDTVVNMEEVKLPHPRCA